MKRHPKFFLTTLAAASALFVATPPALMAEEDEEGDTGSSSKSLVWAGTEGNASWTTHTSVTDWTNGGSADYFATGDSVTFDSTAENKTVAISESLLAGTITVSDDYTFSFSDSETVSATSLTVSSDKTLTLSGAGTLSLSGQNFYSFFFGTSGSVSIGEGTTLSLASLSDSASFTSGNTGRTVLGSGTLSVEATGGIGLYLPNFTGTVAFRAGTVRFSSSTGIYNSSAKLSLASGVGVIFQSDATVSAGITLNGSHTFNSNSYTGTFSGTISGSGATVTKRSAGTVVFSGSSVDLDTLTMQGGGVTFSGTGTYTISTLSTNDGSNAKTLTIGDGSNSTAVTVGSATITYPTAIVINSGSTLNVTGTADFSSGTTAATVSGSGTFNVNSLQFWNSANYTFSGITLNIGSNIYGGPYTTTTFGDGLTLGVSSSSSSWTASANSGTIGFTLSGAVTANPGENQSITFQSSTTLKGEGSLTKTGAGTLTLAGSNTYSGGTTISAGTLVASSASALGTGTVKVQTGGQLQISSDVSLSTGMITVVLDSTNYASLDSSASSTSAALTGSGTLSLSDEQTIVLDVSALDNAGASSASNTYSTYAYYRILSSELASANSSITASSFSLSSTQYYTISSYDSGVITLVAVPEPSTFGLLAGLGALAFVASRRSRRRSRARRG